MKSFKSIPKAVLYFFDKSIWVSVPELGLIEKGYTRDDYDHKVIDLMKGENFNPDFLELNPAGTIPVFVAPVNIPESNQKQEYKILTQSTDILEYVDTTWKPLNRPINGNPLPSLSPESASLKSESDKLISLLHEDVHDPNFLLLGCINRDQIKERGAQDSPMRQYTENRIKALQNNLATYSTASQSIKDFWQEKLKTEEKTLDILLMKASKSDEESFFNRTRTSWKSSVTLLAQFVNTINSNQCDFILGSKVTLVDIQLVPWLARFFLILGYTTPPSPSSIHATELQQRLEKILKLIPNYEIDQLQLRKTCLGLEKYWKTWSERESFKKVYADGLH
ncbi:hypothetical protein DFH28DRAFT_881124 [Melampsora americana]|nr:hypothetical protein DFH28DRAFT_881124 [Melampsora americana]